MGHLVEIAVRLLAVYGLVIVGPGVIAALERMAHLDIGMRVLAIILMMAVSSVIPGLLWLTAPRIAHAVTDSDRDDGAISVNVSLSDALFLSIVIVGLVVLSSAATNLGQVLFWLIRSPFIPESQESELLVRFKYDLFVHEYLVMLVVRSVLGFFLLLRARSIANKILEKSTRVS
jgi:hypothetical protein